MQPRLAGEAVERVGDGDARPQVEVAKLALDVIHRPIAGDLERVRRLNPDDLHHIGGHGADPIRVATNCEAVIAWGLS